MKYEPGTDSRSATSTGGVSWPSDPTRSRRISSAPRVGVLNEQMSCQKGESALRSDDSDLIEGSRLGRQLHVTNIPADNADLVGLEAWSRNRTSTEERFREGKHAVGLNRLPSSDANVNAVWTLAGLLAGALNVMLQSLTGLDTQPHLPGRLWIATLRHQLPGIPGRMTSHAREHLLRLQPQQRLLAHVLTRLRALPAPT